ncbi:MAG TPA: flagellar biosynthesis protein FliQ [Treponemataceae bacterium]|jgi:flagellar biosynthetic protein FliQ|nr:MAG: Flagellar biosynthetic protein FliQ [Spirochaetes bacterium ADurb.Bin269]HOC29159.1 flagellar biosynthesis protein FliQ [Treponemataceae bacterium]HPX48059.1 flagellar biosynthesis protein FliQ [Treponemataceae bacterium]HQL33879.1 flagellar biosynthesis protein FliQ [Treponemataceae bacterium]
MSIGSVVSLVRGSIFEMLILAAPVLGVALIIGLVVAIFQATTSIQEQTLTFVPKILGILGTLALLGSWMFASLREYTINLFELIPSIIR